MFIVHGAHRSKTNDEQRGSFNLYEVIDLIFICGKVVLYLQFNYLYFSTVKPWNIHVVTRLITGTTFETCHLHRVSKTFMLDLFR